MSNLPRKSTPNVLKRSSEVVVSGSQCSLVLKDTYCIGEVNTMHAVVFRFLVGIPLVLHNRAVYAQPYAQARRANDDRKVTKAAGSLARRQSPPRGGSNYTRASRRLRFSPATPCELRQPPLSPA